jgi:SAM-dependent MidA family methyltransferase
VANEWLDVVPLDVLEVDPRGVPRMVEVDDSGEERLGEPAGPEQLQWSRTWWPAQDAVPGTRVEVGLTRDAAWADLVSRIGSGLVVAVDYGHTREHRPAGGTLAGHRDGRAVPPVPDGRCDLTAHVALDSLDATVRRPQREALRELGLDAARPAPGADPAAYLTGLRRAGAAAELLDPGGLGGFGWVERRVAIGQPDPQAARVVR